MKVRTFIFIHEGSVQYSYLKLVLSNGSQFISLTATKHRAFETLWHKRMMSFPNFSAMTWWNFKTLWFTIFILNHSRIFTSDFMWMWYLIYCLIKLLFRKYWKDKHLIVCLRTHLHDQCHQIWLCTCFTRPRKAWKWTKGRRFKIVYGKKLYLEDERIARQLFTRLQAKLVICAESLKPIIRSLLQTSFEFLETGYLWLQIHFSQF